MNFKDLILAYLDERLHGRPSHPVMLRRRKEGGPRHSR